jgi:6-phosphogluconolactonase
MYRYWLTILLLGSGWLAQAQRPYLLVGTYTSNGSHGIYAYRFKDGKARLVDSIAAKNPSFQVVSPNQRYVYSVDENADTTGNYIGGQASAFAFNSSTGRLTRINQQASQGKNPCYITASRSGRWVIVGNYSSGTVSVLPVQKDGGLGPAVQILQHSGSGPNQARQQSAHVHATVFTADNRYLLVPDLGMDKVVVYRFNDGTGQLTEVTQDTAIIKPGSGPRHIVLNRANTVAYLAEELTGNVTVFRFYKGKLTPLQTLSAHPPGYSGAISSADIHLSPDGRFLYCSNRGESNTIAIFKVNAPTGQLTMVGHQSTMGIKPRNFNFDPTGNFLLVANQQTNQIVVFKVNKKTGLLTDTGHRIDVPSPVCIKWVTAGGFSMTGVR